MRILSLLAALALIFSLANTVAAQRVFHVDPKHPELKELDMYGDPYSELLEDRHPFFSDSKLFSPKTPPSLQIDHDYPKLDGAEGLVPIYAAAANVIYRRSSDQVGKKPDPRALAVNLGGSTPDAYKALLDGHADMIFALAPSEDLKKEAADKGFTYTLTPIAREAFVFLVNENNPVKSLSTEQLRDIYSGKINDWKKVGGKSGKIMAFQRPKNSGSQTAMLRDVMHDTPMRKPLEAERPASMGGLLRTVADYRNYGNAIGYSFRYYATTMNSNIPNLRLLSVNGIAPTVENIRNGSYPFTEDFYIITVRPLSENAAKLRDWFANDEGQQFIEDAGFVSLKGR